MSRYKQGVAAVLSVIFYDDLVGFTLPFVSEMRIAVGCQNCIRIYDEDFKLTQTVGVGGSEKGQLLSVYGLCWDKWKRILFGLEYGNQRIQSFDEDGKLIACYDHLPLDTPYHMAISPDCSTLAVVLFLHSQLTLVSAADGKLLRQSEPLFKGPRGVCWLSNQEILVAESFPGGTKRILLVDASALQVKSEWKSELQWHQSWHIAFDEMKGFVFIVDHSANRVIQFSKTGEYLGSIEKHGEEALAQPFAVAVDGRGILYVGDASGVRVFDDTNSKFGDRGALSLCICKI